MPRFALLAMTGVVVTGSVTGSVGVVTGVPVTGVVTGVVETGVVVTGAVSVGVVVTGIVVTGAVETGAVPAGVLPPPPPQAARPAEVAIRPSNWRRVEEVVMAVSLTVN